MRLRKTCLIGLLTLASLSLAAAGDFPQWRGPQQNGLATDKVKLAESWPKTGPVKLWQSDAIIGTKGNGYGCVSVADGKAYVYVNWKYQVPIKTRTVPGDAAHRLGWADFPPKMPEKLFTAMEEARLDPDRATLTGKPLEEWVKKWLDANLPDKADRDRLGPFVANRIRSGKNAGALLTAKLVTTMEDARVDPDRAKLVGKPAEAWLTKWLEANIPDKKDREQLSGWVGGRIRAGAKAFALDDLAKLVTIRNKVFPDAEALNTWLADNAIPADLQAAFIKIVPTEIDQAWDTIFCLEAATGKTIWKKQVDGKPDEWGASSTPCIADGKVYVGSSTGDIYCRDATTGEEVWTYRATGNEKGLVHSSVMVADGLAISLAGPLFALDAKTGSSVWRQPKVTGRENSPVLCRCGDKALVLCTIGEKLVGVDLKTGGLLPWSAPGGSRSTVAVAGDIAVVRSGEKKLDLGTVAYRISPTTQPAKLWCKPDCLGGDTSPAIHDGHVYVLTSAMAVCIDLESGKVCWEQKIGGNGETSPVIADGKIFAMLGQNLEMIQATPEKYAPLAKFPVESSPYASPAVADGKIFIRQSKAIVCYDLTGTVPAPPPTPK